MLTDNELLRNSLNELKKQRFLNTQGYARNQYAQNQSSESPAPGHADEIIEHDGSTLYGESNGNNFAGINLATKDIVFHRMKKDSKGRNVVKLGKV